MVRDAVARRREDAASRDVMMTVVVAVRAGNGDHCPDHETDNCVHLHAFPVRWGGIAPPRRFS